MYRCAIIGVGGNRANGHGDAYASGRIGLGEPSASGEWAQHRQLRPGRCGQTLRLGHAGKILLVVVE